MDVFDAADLSVNPNEMGHSPALVRGVLAGFKKDVYKRQEYQPARKKGKGQGSLRRYNRDCSQHKLSLIHI